MSGQKKPAKRRSTLQQLEKREMRDGHGLVADVEFTDPSCSDVLSEYACTPSANPAAMHQASVAGASASTAVDDMGNSADVLAEVAYQLHHTLGLQFEQSYYEDWGGHGEKWIASKNGDWYFIEPNGDLFLWSGSRYLAESQIVATLDASYHADPAKLHDESSLRPTGQATSWQLQLAYELDQKLELRYPDTYAYDWGGHGEKWIIGENGWYFIEPDGTFYEWDGNRDLSTSQKLETLHSVFHAAPSALHDAEAPPQDANAVDLLISTARELDLSLGLRFKDSYHANRGNHGEKWISSQTGKWYFIEPSGAVFEWDGQRDLSTSERIQTFDASYHADPAKLHDPPPKLPDLTGIDSAAGKAFMLQQTLGLQFDGSYYLNWGGRHEKWMLGENAAWFFIDPIGDLYHWGGHADLSSSRLIAQLDETFYADPQKLHTASAIEFDEETGRATVFGTLYNDHLRIDTVNLNATRAMPADVDDWGIHGWHTLSLNWGSHVEQFDVRELKEIVFEGLAGEDTFENNSVLEILARSAVEAAAHTPILHPDGTLFVEQIQGVDKLLIEELGNLVYVRDFTNPTDALYQFEKSRVNKVIFFSDYAGDYVENRSDIDFTFVSEKHELNIESGFVVSIDDLLGVKMPDAEMALALVTSPAHGSLYWIDANGTRIPIPTGPLTIPESDDASGEWLLEYLPESRFLGVDTVALRLGEGTSDKWLAFVVAPIGSSETSDEIDLDPVELEFEKAAQSGEGGIDQPVAIPPSTHGVTIQSASSHSIYRLGPAMVSPVNPKYTGGKVKIRVDSKGNGYIASPRRNGELHNGIDVAAPVGTPVRSVGDGTVIQSKYSALDGYRVTIMHKMGGTTWYTSYSHLNAKRIKNGVRVEGGQTIGYVDTTGNARGTTPHVHFEVRDSQGNVRGPNLYARGNELYYKSSRYRNSSVPLSINKQQPPRVNSDEVVVYRWQVDFGRRSDNGKCNELYSTYSDPNDVITAIKGIREWASRINTGGGLDVTQICITGIPHVRSRSRGFAPLPYEEAERQLRGRLADAGISEENDSGIPMTVDLEPAVYVPLETVDDRRFSTTITVSNRGAQNSGAYEVAYYLSNDATIDESDLLIKRERRSSIVNPTGFGPWVDQWKENIDLPNTLQSGSYYFGVIVDADNNVAETNESNNASSGRRIPEMDLQPLISVESPGDWSYVPVNAPVRLDVSMNKGGWENVGPYSVSYYLSRDGVVDASDALLSKSRRPGVTNPSGGGSWSDSWTEELTLPQDLDFGEKYFVLAVADPGNQLPETNESNNVGLAELRPVLPVEMLAPEVIRAGEDFSVDMTFASAFSQGPYRVEYLLLDSNGMEYSYLTEDGERRNIQLFPTIERPQISAGETQRWTDTLNLPYVVEAGDYTLSASVDLPGIDEDSSLWGSPWMFEASLHLTVTPAAADLAPVSAAPLGNFHILPDGKNVVRSLTGAMIEVSAGVRTNGWNPNHQFTIAYYLSNDASIDGEDQLLKKSSHSQRYNPGSNTQYVTDSLMLPDALDPGEYFIGVVVDPDNDITEMDEGNNAFVATEYNLLVINDVDLELVNYTLPPDPGPGDEFSVLTTVANNGTAASQEFDVEFYLIQKSESQAGYSQWGDKFIPLANAVRPALSAGKSDEWSQLIHLPAELDPGDYYLSVIVNRVNMDSENDAMNNVIWDSGPPLFQVFAEGSDVDLRVAASPPGAILPEGPVVQLPLSVTNGGADKAAEYGVSFTLRELGESESSAVLLKEVTRPGMDGFATQSWTEEIVLPATVQDLKSYEIVAVVDANEAITEKNEENNTHVHAFWFSSPSDLALLSVDTPDEIFRGQQLTVDMSVVNESDYGSGEYHITFYLSRDPEVDTYDDNFGIVHLIENQPGIAARAEDRWTETIEIPDWWWDDDDPDNRLEGEFFLVVRVDKYGDENSENDALVSSRPIRFTP